jgi:hypothetical protein
MDATTPKIKNLTPKTGRLITELDKVVNVVDEYGSIKVIDVSNSSVHAGTSYTYTATASLAGFNWVESDHG